MNGTRLRLETARGCMSLLAGQSFLEMFEVFGVNVEELQEVTGAKPWNHLARNRVRRVLDAVGQGIMDVVGTPRFELPAEYMAAVITSFVHPTNIMVACRWMESGRPGVVLQTGSAEQVEPVSPAQLFALCCGLLEDDGGEKLRAQFEKRVRGALSRALREDVGDAKK